MTLSQSDGFLAVIWTLLRIRVTLSLMLDESKREESPRKIDPHGARGRPVSLMQRGNLICLRVLAAGYVLQLHESKAAKSASRNRNADSPDTTARLLLATCRTQNSRLRCRQCFCRRTHRQQGQSKAKGGATLSRPSILAQFALFVLALSRVAQCWPPDAVCMNKDFVRPGPHSRHAVAALLFM